MKKSFRESQDRLSWRNLHLVMFESAITAGLLCLSIMSPFFLSIGLCQSEIAASQAIFTIVTIFLDLPTGWLADRFSRKWANVVGDLGHALVLLGYATAQNFQSVITYETLSAIFLSLSKGVDLSLLKHFSGQIDPSEKLFREKSAQLAILQHAATLVLLMLGGPIGAISFRLAITLSGVPYWLGGITSLFIRDDSRKLSASCQNPLIDMWRIVRYSLKDKPLRLRIAVHAVGREMTHIIIWFFTPMLIYVGVPLPIVSCVWAINSLTCIIGAKIATRLVTKLSDWQILAVPLTLMIISMGTISISLNKVTVWLYLLMGVTQGWTSATFSPMVQRYVKPEEQTSVLSFTSVVGKLIYVPVIFVSGWMADFSVRYAALITLIVFGALGSYLLIKLLRE